MPLDLVLMDEEGQVEARIEEEPTTGADFGVDIEAGFLRVLRLVERAVWTLVIVIV